METTIQANYDNHVDYLKQLQTSLGIKLTRDHIENYIFLGNINGKMTPFGMKSAYELGMEATFEELDQIEAIYEAIQ